MTPDVRVGRPRKLPALLEVVERISYPDYSFTLKEVGERIYLQACYMEADVDTGVIEKQATRKWYLSHSATDSEIAQTAFKCILTSAEHRIREHFTYRGARVFGPHFDVEDLVLILKRNERDKK